MSKFLIFIFFLIISGQRLVGQRHNFMSRSEIGFMGGGTYYIGDLNPSKQFQNTQIAGGLMFRHTIHSRFSIRASLLYGSVKADDALSNNLLLNNRNLSFSSSIFELSTNVEFTYLPFEVGHNKYKGTAYLTVGLGVFKMNPMTTYEGNNIALQPLGTEGQSSSLGASQSYSLNQLCIPFGIGVKGSLSKRLALSVEFGIRKTFTDYLDDVHSNTYINTAQLSDVNGTISSSLSNRSLDGNNNGFRGDPSTKDWYIFSGVMLSIRLGDPSNCFYH